MRRIEGIEAFKKRGVNVDDGSAEFIARQIIGPRQTRTPKRAAKARGKLEFNFLTYLGIPFGELQFTVRGDPWRERHWSPIETSVGRPRSLDDDSAHLFLTERKF